MWLVTEHGSEPGGEPIEDTSGVGGTLMPRLYGRDPNGRYYPVRSGIWGVYREPPRGLPGKPVLKLLLVLAVIIVIASFV
jgi:hypothetical protein